MMKTLLAVAALSVLLVACGGGGSASGGDSGADGTAAMAAGFSTELTKVKECVQGEVNGGAPCTTNFLEDPVTKMCSDVRTGKPNTDYPEADLTKFTATCDDWKAFLTLDAATKVTTLEKMIADAAALK